MNYIMYIFPSIQESQFYYLDVIVAFSPQIKP